MTLPQFTLTLPQWIENELPQAGKAIPHIEDRMRLVLKLGHHNIEHRTGGPFAAAVFDTRDNTLIAAGVNLVESLKASVLHAEIVALTLAQVIKKQYDLSLNNGVYELVTTGEPCTQCLGAVHWSGVRSLVIASRDEDITSTGFDEGPKPAAWPEALRSRGISVTQDILREQGKELLQRYQTLGGTNYGARTSPLR